MDKDKEKQMVSRIVCVAIENVADRLDIDPIKAIEYFYYSKTYEKYMKNEDKLRFSPNMLSTAVIHELIGEDSSVEINDGINSYSL